MGYNKIEAIDGWHMVINLNCTLNDSIVCMLHQPTNNKFAYLILPFQMTMFRL